MLAMYDTYHCPRIWGTFVHYTVYEGFHRMLAMYDITHHCPRIWGSLYIAPYVRVFMLLTDGGQQNLSHYKKISVKYSGATIWLWEQLIGTSFVVSPLLFFLFLLDFWFPFLVCTFFSSFVLIVAVLLFAHNEVVSCFGFLFIGKSKTMCVSD